MMQGFALSIGEGVMLAMMVVVLLVVLVRNK
jgi:hypothetical protein